MDYFGFELNIVVLGFLLVNYVGWGMWYNVGLWEVIYFFNNYDRVFVMCVGDIEVNRIDENFCFGGVRMLVER